MDIYNGFVEIGFKVTKLVDNGGYNQAFNIGTINGSFSLISQSKCEYNGIFVIDTPYVNHSINLKNMVEFSQEYSDKVGPSMFWYPDTNASAYSKEYTTYTVADTGGTNRSLIGAKDPLYNYGFTQRKDLLSANAEVNTVYPLNRFGFFGAFEDRILPNGRLSLDFTLERDDNVIFQVAGAGDNDIGRVVVTKMVLWIPKMELNVAGKKILFEKYLKNQSWYYLNERIEISPVLKVRQGTCNGRSR